MKKNEKMENLVLIDHWNWVIIGTWKFSSNAYNDDF